MKWLWIFWILAWPLFASAAVDREAFTFTNYDLDVRIEPEQHRLAVRGKIILRNDSLTPQKNLSLQISSSLDWRSIKVDGKPVDFASQNYASDIDHTGALSEAIVTLPTVVTPKNTIELEIGYDGVIVQDATRLVRIGIPENIAKHSEWDEIRKSFSGVRGIGYVTWYPVAVESASLSEGTSVEAAIGRWKKREADGKMLVNFSPVNDASSYFSGKKITDAEGGTQYSTDVASVPTFAIGDYQKLDPDEQTEILFASWQADAAKTYSDAVTTLAPMPKIGGATGELKICGLPDSDDLAFVTNGMLLTPMKSPITNDAMLNLVYARALTSIESPREWIKDGLAHFAQVMFVEQEGNPVAALDYLKSHQGALIEAEKKVNDNSDRSLINALDSLYLQTKAMYVWWMLRDMLHSDPRLMLGDYKAQDDKDPQYLQHLLEKSAQKDLGWFFDDWVYHDRGLPDFRVSYVNVAPISSGYLVTITVENLGGAGAEVPLTLKMQEGQIDKKIEVRGKSKATLRIQAPSKPMEIVINDGSVPESDTSNNTYEIGEVKQGVQ